MAESTTHNWPTLANLVQKGDPIIGQIYKEVDFLTPFFDMLPAAVIEGTNSKELVTTAFPLSHAAPFNSGVRPFKSSYETRNFETKPYPAMAAIDTKLVHAFPRKAGEYMETEIYNRILGFKAMMELTLFYGSLVSPFGYLGVNDMMGDFMTISADSAHNTTDTRLHGGMSVWAAHINSKTMKMLFSGSSGIAFGPQRMETLPCDTADGQPGYMEALVRHMNVCPGLALTDNCAVARLVNVSADKPLTDDLLSKLVNVFPNRLQPNVIFMSKEAAGLLQQSRSAKFVYQKKTSGETNSADFPTSYLNIPIKITSGLIEDETLENLDKLKNMIQIEAEQGHGKIKR